MRIPSQFNEDSLYRPNPRSSQSAQSHRRLLRLVLGLALVLVLMRQAARPELYRVFFGANAPPQPAVVFRNVDAADSDRSSTGTLAGSGTSDAAAGAGTEVWAIQPEDRTVANALVASLPRGDQRRWVIALTRWLRQKPVPENPSTTQNLRSEIESMDSLAEPQRASWLQMLDSLAEYVAAQGGGDVTEPAVGFEVSAASDDGTLEDAVAITERDGQVASAFLDSLDAAADSRVIDGSVWRAGDFDSFYRYLDQSPEFTPNGLAATGVLPLLQQPDVFRGQLVRVQGVVARAEQLDAIENLYGIESYWQLWLRPSDGVERPIVAIVPQVDDSIAAMRSASDEEGPPVVVAGRFLKRLAYTSGMGADLAPVVVGQLAFAAPSTDVEVADVAPAAGNLPLQITVVLACLAGLGLAFFVTWRTTAAARDSRRIRNSNRPGPNFTGLDLAVAEIDTTHSSSSERT